MIGQIVSHYRIISQLGEGGMGVVYEAEDINLGRRVAMKFLSTTTRDYRARFLREARAVSALTHPNIATVFDYGETEQGQPFIVMELIKGEPLNDKLREGSLPLPEAVSIISAIGEALGEAHHHGVVHRDVKPSNVVINERGHVKVLDFGLVKHIVEPAALAGDPNQKTLPSTRTHSDVIVGTPLYLSPEQATGKSVDGRSDLFALGAVLYECITGRSAFAGASIIEIGAQVIHVTPSVPSRLNQSVLPELDRITMKAIEKKVEDRYQTAEEFVFDLRAVLPALDSNGYRTKRSTDSLEAAPTATASALTTLIEPFRRPGPNLGIFILAIVGVALVSWLLVRWWKPGAYVPVPEAQTMYDKGTDALRYGAFLQATKALEEAVRIDDKFAMAHARLGEAWYELDYADKAKDELLKAQPLGQAPSTLPQLDALHLEAIHATVTQDFPGAIKAYGEIARLLPKDPQVYVDLGRAYEKDDQIEAAIRSFQQATQLAHQHPTAYLLLAIMYGKQINLPAAFENFDRADTLYEAAGNFEGQAEVAYQRGFLLNQNEKSSEARPQLERSLELARTTHSEYGQVKTLLKLGEVIFSEGKMDEGRAYMRQGIELAERNGIDNYVKRGLVDLGNTFMRSRDYAEAEKLFRQSLQLSQRQKDPRNVARALTSLASASERQNNLDPAVSYVEQALPFYQRGGYRRETIQAFAILARTKRKKGDYQAALAAGEQELKIAQFLNEQALIARATVDVGLVLMNEARYPEALTHFEEGYNLAKSINHIENKGLFLTDRANALWNLGRYSEANPLFDEVGQTAARPEARGFAYWYFLSSARMALSERKFDEAIKKAEDAIKANTLPPLTETSLIGLAQTLSGKSAGRAKCQKALELMTADTDPLLAAEVHGSLAEALLQSGDASGALKYAVEAQQTFARLGKPDAEWVALLTAARARRRDNDLAQAREYASQAERILAGLQQKWGDENYQSYLARPDVQFYRNQLNELLTQRP
jgi:tetratricopeptide (TPR) repeat protein/predicted Ser/Thr protein kinase